MNKKIIVVTLTTCLTLGNALPVFAQKNNRKKILPIAVSYMGKYTSFIPEKSGQSYL